MYRESMQDFADAFSSAKEKFSKYVSEKYKGFADWIKLGRRKNFFVRRMNRFYGNFKNVLYGYAKYLGREFVPFVVAYGLIINVPISVLLGWPLTVETVVSWGLLFYLVNEEFYPMLKELFSEIG